MNAAHDTVAHGGHADHHRMVLDNLVRMINRIGDFYAAYPDRAEAIDGIAGHVRRFWEPRMRRQLFAHLDGGAQGEGLSVLVREAVLARRAELQPRD
jgi:formate dehydrogenase subunit delta